jgi:hypothetical protein
MLGLTHHFCKHFADDTKLIFVIKSPEDRVLLQDDINRLVEWSNVWRMSFNKKNCKVIRFGKRLYNVLNAAFLEDDLNEVEFTIVDSISIHTLELHS